MVFFLIIPIGAAAIIGARQVHKHVHERKQKKRALKALQHGPVEEVTIVDRAAEEEAEMDVPPAYQEKSPSQYTGAEQHPALRASNESAGLPAYS